MKYTLEQWKDEANKVYMSHQKLKNYKKKKVNLNFKK